MIIVLTLPYVATDTVLSVTVEVGSTSYYISRMVESLCIVTVNCYVLISGYFWYIMNLLLKK